jgi:thiosulfate dehydrogenase
MGGKRRGLSVFALGVVCAVIGAFAFAFIYFKWGHPPVATADRPFPFEAEIVKLPLGARIHGELVKAPFPDSAEVNLDGAMVYKDQCAMCHGAPGEDVAFAKHMFPVAPQLFKKHAKNDVVGVSDDEVGETYWKVKNGIRLTGMPAFDKVLTDEEMWDVSLLLKNADQPLSTAVKGTLTK